MRAARAAPTRSIQEVQTATGHHPVAVFLLERAAECLAPDVNRATDVASSRVSPSVVRQRGVIRLRAPNPVAVLPSANIPIPSSAVCLTPRVKECLGVPLRTGEHILKQCACLT